MDSNLMLAKVSLKGKNFEDAYTKYSKVVESDSKNVEAWIGKGISAGYLSNPGRFRIDESKICLNYAKELGLSSGQKVFINQEVISITKHFITELINKAKGIIDDKSKTPKSTFELHSVRSVSNTADRYEANNKIFDQVLNAINFAKLTDEFEGGVNYKKEQINVIDKFSSEINNELHADKIKKLLAIRENIVQEISSTDPSYNAPNAPKSGGCFIATSIYGDYDNKNVVVLRYFRDKTLLKYSLGAYFVKQYYRFSPTVVAYFWNKKYLKATVRIFFIAPLVSILKNLKYAKHNEGVI